MLLVLGLMVAPVISAQSDAESPCQTPEAQRFDFWVGDWRVAWGAGAQGSNRVSKRLDGCVIEEQFDGRPGTNLVGTSVSVYDQRAGVWKQTWVDNQGGYLDFTGGWQDNRMVLSRSASRDGVDFLQRMVWYDITEDALQWHWERSDDGGQTWQVLWHLRYMRRDSPGDPRSDRRSDP